MTHVRVSSFKVFLTFSAASNLCFKKKFHSTLVCKQQDEKKNVIMEGGSTENIPTYKLNQNI